MEAESASSLMRIVQKGGDKHFCAITERCYWTEIIMVED